MSRDPRVGYARALRRADMSTATGQRRSLPTGRGLSGPSDKAFQRAVARVAQSGLSEDRAREAVGRA